MNRWHPDLIRPHAGIRRRDASGKRLGDRFADRVIFRDAGASSHVADFIPEAVEVAGADGGLDATTHAGFVIGALEAQVVDARRPGRVAVGVIDADTAPA